MGVVVVSAVHTDDPGVSVDLGASAAPCAAVVLEVEAAAAAEVLEAAAEVPTSVLRPVV